MTNLIFSAFENSIKAMRSEALSAEITKGISLFATLFNERRSLLEYLIESGILLLNSKSLFSSKILANFRLSCTSKILADLDSFPVSSEANNAKSFLTILPGLPEREKADPNPLNSLQD